MDLYTTRWTTSKAPALPIKNPAEAYARDLNNVLRIYFNQVDSTIGQLVGFVNTNNYYAKDTNTYGVVGSQNAVTVGTSYVPLVSIRLASDSFSSVVVPYLCTGSTDNVPSTFTIAVVKNTTLTGASYNTTTFPHVDYDTTATSMAGGTVITSKVVVNGAQFQLLDVFDPQLRIVDVAGVSDVYTLAAKVGTGTATVSGSIQFVDVA